jgi:hypothetical protein
MSDFFDPPPPLQPEPPTPEWDGPPDGVVPVTLPVERVIARTDAVVIYLAALVAYPTGFQFDLFVLADGSDEELDPFDFSYRETGRRTGEIQPGLLRLGFAFADGTKATNTGAYFNQHEWGEDAARPDAPVMAGGPGSGDQGTWQSTWWVWPLPPPGPLQFVCEWPAAAIPQTRVDLDGASLLDAAGRVS